MLSLTLFLSPSPFAVAVLLQSTDALHDDASTMHRRRASNQDRIQQDASGRMARAGYLEQGASSTCGSRVLLMRSQASRFLPFLLGVADDPAHATGDRGADSKDSLLAAECSPATAGTLSQWLLFSQSDCALS